MRELLSSSIFRFMYFPLYPLLVIKRGLFCGNARQSYTIYTTIIISTGFGQRDYSSVARKQFISLRPTSSNASLVFHFVLVACKSITVHQVDQFMALSLNGITDEFITPPPSFLVNEIVEASASVPRKPFCTYY